MGTRTVSVNQPIHLCPLTYINNFILHAWRLPKETVHYFRWGFFFFPLKGSKARHYSLLRAPEPRWHFTCPQSSSAEGPEMPRRMRQLTCWNVWITTSYVHKIPHTEYLNTEHYNVYFHLQTPSQWSVPLFSTATSSLLYGSTYWGGWRLTRATSETREAGRQHLRVSTRELKGGLLTKQIDLSNREVPK